MAAKKTGKSKSAKTDAKAAIGIIGRERALFDGRG